MVHSASVLTTASKVPPGKGSDWASAVLSSTCRPSSSAVDCATASIPALMSTPVSRIAAS